MPTQVLNEKEDFVVKLDVDEDGKADFILEIRKDSAKSWVIRLIRWLIIRFIL